MIENFVRKNVDIVKQKVEQVASKSGRDASDIRIIAVTKTAESDILPNLLDAGIENAAENRWQVARDKFSHPDSEKFTWHFIGSLQTNKVKYIVPRFAWIHSVDRLDLAEAVSDEAVKRDVVSQLLVQVNVAGEVQKHGISPDDTISLIKAISQLDNVVVRGLMTMAPLVDDVEHTRPVFHALADLFRTCKDALGLETFDQLSMGMSDDFTVAVEEGATMLRIGRRLVLPPPDGKG